MRKYILFAIILGIFACAKKEDPSGVKAGKIDTGYRIDFSKVESFDSALVVVRANGDTILQGMYTKDSLEKEKLSFSFSAMEFDAIKIECFVYSNEELIARLQEILTSGDVPQQPALNLAPIAQASSDSLGDQGKDKVFSGTAIDLENGVVAYQWDYDGDGVWDDSLPTAIGFTHVYADTGRYMAVFQVTDDMGMQGRDTLFVVVRNHAPVIDSMWFTGSLQEDSIVEIEYQYLDSEDDVEASTSLQWLRNGNPIEGATDMEYEIAYADSGAKLACVATPKAKTGTIEGESDTLVLGTVKGFQAPVASNVKISGTARVDSTLRASYTFSDADGDVEGKSIFRWYRNGEIIPGANGKTLKITVDEMDARILFEVIPVSATGKNPQGKAARSDESANVFNPSAPYVTNVSVGGALYRDSTVKVVYTYNDDDGDAELGTTFQWYRNGVAVDGATSKTYKITIADKDAQLRVQVTPAAATGEFKDAGVAVMSPPAGPVAGYTAPVVTDVTISGSFAQNGTLTVGYNYSDAENDLQGASLVTWYRNGVQAHQGTEKTYSITKLDSGKVISVEVTPIAKTGTLLTGVAVASSEIYPEVTGFHYPVAKYFKIDKGLSAVGETLSIIYTFADDDNDEPDLPQVSWCGIDPTGFADVCELLSEGALTYQLTAADIGKIIVVQMRPVAKSGDNLVGDMVSDTFYTQNSATVKYSGVEYPIISVGAQDWFALNLRYSAGGTIGVVPASAGYVEADLGRLYTWNEAVTGTGEDICPDGWHIPSTAEFEEMIWVVGAGLAGGNPDPDQIRSTSTSYWSEAGTDLYGLNIQGAGYELSSSHAGFKSNANIWTSTIDTQTPGTSFFIQLISSAWSTLSASQTNRMNSIRCMRGP